MNEETVIKCKECGKYFGYTKEEGECRLCHAKYDEKDARGDKDNKGYIKKNKGPIKLRVKS